MTPQEIKELQEKITAEVMIVYNEECQIFELEETTMGIVSKMKYVNRIEKKSIDLWGNSFEAVSDLYNVFIKELGKYHTEPTISGDAYDDEINIIYFRSEAYELFTSYQIGNVIENKTRQSLSKFLRPASYNGYTRIAQCEMIALFMDGKIDWETLQKITYQGCEI